VSFGVVDGPIRRGVPTVFGILMSPDWSRRIRRDNLWQGDRRAKHVCLAPRQHRRSGLDKTRGSRGEIVSTRREIGPDAAGQGKPDRYKWIALSNTTLGILMVTINSSIILIALPNIFRGIGLDPLTPGNTSYLLWMLLGFMVCTAVLLVSFGRIGDMYGRVRMTPSYRSCSTRRVRSVRDVAKHRPFGTFYFVGSLTRDWV